MRQLDADYMVSPDGGDEPSWSPDGQELYFHHAANLVTVKVQVVLDWLAEVRARLAAAR